MIRGTVDIGKMAVYYMRRRSHIIFLNVAFSPVFPWSQWKFNDFVSSSDWMSPTYNDSLWNVGSKDSFAPFFQERYYRISVVLNPSVLVTYASFECFVSHLFSVEVFINGVRFLTHEASSKLANTTVETVKREALHRYFRSSSNVVAIRVYCDQTQYVCDSFTTDPFTAHFVFFSFDTPTSNNMKLRSVHDVDYYAHPLVYAFDDSRVSEWWFRGRTADVFIDYTNPLYKLGDCDVMCRGEFVNEYSIVSSSQDPSSDISSWEFYGSKNNVDFDLLDSQTDILFSYRNQRLTFPLNNFPLNYRTFLLKICTLFVLSLK